MGNFLGNIENGIVALKRQYLDPIGNQVGQAMQTPVEQMVNSPLGLAVQGKFSQVLPAIEQEFSPKGSTIAGKPYKPQMMMAGEMTTNPADTAIFPGHDYTGKNTWSPFIRDPKAGIIENPDFSAGSASPTKYAQTAPEYPQNTANPETLNVAGEQTSPQTNPVNVPPQPKLNLRQAFQQKVNGLSNYQLPQSESEYRVPNEATDKGIMANVTGGNTADQVLKNVIPAKKAVWSQIEQHASQIPDVSVDKSIMPYIDEQLQKQLGEQGYANDTQIQQIAQAEKLRILGRTADSGLNPNETIPGSKVIDLRTGANGRSPGYLGDNPTLTQRVNKAVADGYEQAVGSLDPTIQYLYDQYSSLKRIGAMPDSFRNQKLNIGKIPGTNIGVPFTGLGRRALGSAIGGNPLAIGAIGLPIIGGLAAGANALGLPKMGEDFIANALGYKEKNPANGSNGVINDGSTPPQNDNPQNNINNHKMSISMIPNQQSDIKPQSNGSYSVAAPEQITDQAGNPLGIADNDYKSQVKQLNSDIAAKSIIAAQTIEHPLEAQTAQGQIAQDKQQLESLKTNYDTSSKLNTGYQFTNTVTGKVNNALSMLNSTAPNITNINGAVDNLRKSLDPNYAGLSSELAAIQKEYGSTFNAATRQVLQAELTKVAQQIGYDYYQAINTYVGGNTSSGNAAASPAQVSGLPPIPQSPQSLPASMLQQPVGGQLPNMQPQFPNQ